MKAKLAVLAGIAVLGIASVANAQTFSNPGLITIPSAGPGTPYPSDISVVGMAAGPWDIDVAFGAMSHTFPDDVDILLVGPSGNVMLMSDCGGSLDIVGVLLTFSDGSPSLPDGTQIVSGTFAPTNFGARTMAAPAPVGPYGASLNALGLGDVNGTWSLYVQDDLGGDIGSIAGWSITFTPAPSALALLGLAGLVGAGRRRRA